MTALFTKHLTLVAGADHGVTLLRKTILDLAIRGLLVGQDKTDETANAMLVRAAALKAAKQAELKAAPEGAPNVPYELPCGWAWTTLADVAIINPRNQAADDSEGSFVPMAAIGTGFGDRHAQETRRWGDIKTGFTHFAEGDVGVAKITPCFENSKACVFSGLVNGLGAGTTELHVIRPLGGTLAPRYVLAYLKSPWFLDNGESKMTGTAGQKRLPKDFVARHPFPLPPLAEQHRIVAKVDELMALCDRLEARQQDAEAAHARMVQALLDSLAQARDAADLMVCWQRLAHLFPEALVAETAVERLRQVVQQLGVMGKLTSREPTDGLSVDLLSKISAVRSTALAVGHSRAPRGAVGMVGKEVPYDLPDEWCWSTAEQVCEVIVDCPHSTPKFVPSGVLCLDTNSVKQGQIVAERSRYVDESTYAERVARLVPQPGDVVFTREGTVGESVVIPVGVRCCLGQRVMLFRPCLVEPAYLQLALSEPSAVSRQLAMHKGIGAKHVNVADMRAAWVPLPPLAEQRRIVAKVTELLALCDQLNARIAVARAKHAQLAEALVAQAATA